MKKILIVMLSFLMFSCIQEEKKEKWRYNDICELMNDCKGVSVVVSTSFDEAYFDGHDYFIIVRDSTGRFYTYQGSNYNLKRGDTLTN